MFTGIIEDVGRIERVELGGGGARLVVATGLASGELGEIALGASVAVMGACLTVTRHERGRLAFDVSRETLARTTLGGLKVGARVHLERALRLGDRLDGHLVQGHVDAVGRLVDRVRVGDGWELGYELPAALMPQVVEKGSITLDGVSLTVARLVERRVTIAVVPHTAAHTVLSETEVGAGVNVETDVLGKYVQRVLSLRGESAGGIDLAFLKEHGF